MSTPTRIAATFADLKSRKSMAFMPFIAAGDPDMNATLTLLRELASRGVDLIEVGFPYSDPIADGPVIQASYTRALQHGLHVRDIFAGIKSLASENIPPLVAMVSYAIIFRTGPEQFVQQAANAGFSGLIVPDLPADEAQDLAPLAKSHGLDLVQLIAPTTTPDRISRILETASGFLYCISVAGTTGERDELPAVLKDQLTDLRTRTDLPLAVGFGISRPDQVAPLRGVADGVIVGSGLVRRLQSVADKTATLEEAVEIIGNFATEMVTATRASK